MAMTVVGVFDDRRTASVVMRALRESDVSSETISVLTPQDVDATDLAEGHVIVEQAAVGAGTGAVLGGIGGLALGLAALAVPGIGPLLVAGPLATALAGAGVGATAGGVIGVITGLGVPEPEAARYAEALRRGATLVTVTADEPLAAKAEAMMNHHGAIDIEERAAEWEAASESSPEDSIRECTMDDLRRERDTEVRERATRARGARSYRRDLVSEAECFGAALARHPHYAGHGWVVLEPEARRQWEEREPGTWDALSDAVRRGWQAAREGRAA